MSAATLELMESPSLVSANDDWTREDLEAARLHEAHCDEYESLMWQERHRYQGYRHYAYVVWFGNDRIKVGSTGDLYTRMAHYKRMAKQHGIELLEWHSWAPLPSKQWSCALERAVIKRFRKPDPACHYDRYLARGVKPILEMREWFLGDIGAFSKIKSHGARVRQGIEKSAPAKNELFFCEHWGSISPVYATGECTTLRLLSEEDDGADS